MIRPHLRPGDDRGQIATALILVVALAALAAGFMFFEVGRSSDLRAGAQTAADAAALAAAESLRGDIRQALRDAQFFEVEQGVLASRGCDLARAYAQDNDAEATACDVDAGGWPERVRFTVQVETEDSLDGARANQVGAEGTSGVAQARAEYRLDPTCDLSVCLFDEIVTIPEPPPEPPEPEPEPGDPTEEPEPEPEPEPPPEPIITYEPRPVDPDDVAVFSTRLVPLGG